MGTARILNIGGSLILPIEITLLTATPSGGYVDVESFVRAHQERKDADVFAGGHIFFWLGNQTFKLSAIGNCYGGDSR